MDLRDALDRGQGAGWHTHVQQRRIAQICIRLCYA
jgi:hypothetical protein